MAKDMTRARERADGRAMHLSENTNIILARRTPSQQAQLHLVAPSGLRTLCGVSPESWEGVSPQAHKIHSEKRVCETCTSRTTQAYGYPFTAQRVLRDFNAWLSL